MTDRMSNEEWAKIKEAIKGRKMYSGQLRGMEAEIDRARKAEKRLVADKKLFVGIQEADADTIKRLEAENAVLKRLNTMRNRR